MKAVISLASVLACAFSLNAQITAVIKRFPARSPEIEIRNNSTVSLTAFAIGTPPLMLYVDTAVATDPLVSHLLNTTMPLLPNQRYAIPLPARSRSRPPLEDLSEPPIVTSGVFADGTTTGDPALLARFITRRANMLRAVRSARLYPSHAARRN